MHPLEVRSFLRHAGFKDPLDEARKNETESTKAHWEAKEDASRITVLREIIAELMSGRDIRLILSTRVSVTFTRELKLDQTAARKSGI